MVSDLKTFTNELWKIAAQKKIGFMANFALLSRILLVLVFLTLFNGLFAPTSRNPMSKLFRLSESLGKSNGKKWSQIWKLLLINGVKLLRRKKKFQTFFICSLRLNVFVPHPVMHWPAQYSYVLHCTTPNCSLVQWTPTNITTLQFTAPKQKVFYVFNISRLQCSRRHLWKLVIWKYFSVARAVQ